MVLNELEEVYNKIANKSYYTIKDITLMSFMENINIDNILSVKNFIEFFTDSDIFMKIVVDYNGILKMFNRSQKEGKEDYLTGILLIYNELINKYKNTPNKSDVIYIIDGIVQDLINYKYPLMVDDHLNTNYKDDKHVVVDRYRRIYSESALNEVSTIFQNCSLIPAIHSDFIKNYNTATFKLVEVKALDELVTFDTLMREYNTLDIKKEEGNNENNAKAFIGELNAMKDSVFSNVVNTIQLSNELLFKILNNRKSVNCLYPLVYIFTVFNIFYYINSISLIILRLPQLRIDNLQKNDGQTETTQN